jgi:Rieske Fe-S protein
MNITRKDFFVKTAQGIAILSLPSIFSSFLESCNSPTAPISAATLPVLQGTFSNGIVTVGIDPSSSLAKAGGAAIINNSSGPLLIDHPSGTTYNAFSAICTHQGCTISNYDSGSSQFVCLCHGSRYDINGKVVQGPASTALQQYQTSFSNNQLLITL